MAEIKIKNQVSKLMNAKKQKRLNKKQLLKETINDLVDKKHHYFFSLIHLKQLFKKDNFVQEVSNYMNKFFFKYKGNIFYDNGITFELLSIYEAQKKIPKEYRKTIKIIEDEKEIKKNITLRDYFEHELFLITDETELTIDYDQPKKFKSTKNIQNFDINYNFLNMKKELPRNYNVKIELNEENVKGRDMFFNHIKKIICSDNEDEYDITKKFLAASCFGHKVKLALYWKSLERSGKGTVLNYMMDLLGNKAENRGHKTSSIEEVILYNKKFEGKTLINLDEMPCQTTSNKGLQDSLKSLITEPTFNCRQMYNESYIQQNTFNIIITSNNDAINLTQSNNMRYFVNTINESYIGNEDYFNEINKYIYLEDVKILVFQEFLRIYEEEIKPINWIGNNAPLTEAGKLKRIEALPKFIKWIKTKYLQKGVGINESCNDLRDYYKIEVNGNDTIQKIGKFCKDLNIKQVEKKVKEGDKYVHRNRYVISYEDLYKSFKQKNYIDENFDEIPIIESETENIEENSKEKIEEIDYKTLYENQNREMEDLKLKILEIQNNNKTNDEITIVENNIETKIVKIKEEDNYEADDDEENIKHDIKMMFSLTKKSNKNICLFT
jgi:hypothetical protein